MKKVLMLETAPGADEDKNGQNMGVKMYAQGEAYTLSDMLADLFIAQGFAKPYSIPEALGLLPEKKNLGAATENKMIKPKRARKAKS